MVGLQSCCNRLPISAYFFVIGSSTSRRYAAISLDDLYRTHNVRRAFIVCLRPGKEQFLLRGQLQSIEQVLARIYVAQRAGHRQTLCSPHLVGADVRPVEQPGAPPHGYGTPTPLRGQLVGRFTRRIRHRCQDRYSRIITDPSRHRHSCRVGKDLFSRPADS